MNVIITRLHVGAKAMSGGRKYVWFFWLMCVGRNQTSIFSLNILVIHKLWMLVETFLAGISKRVYLECVFLKWEIPI